MSGPIVRSAPSEKFTDNWSQAFSSKNAAASKKAAPQKAAPPKAAPKKASAKAKTTKKAKKKA